MKFGRQKISSIKLRRFETRSSDNNRGYSPFLARALFILCLTLRTGVGEQAAPDSLEVYPSDLVQFVSTDWMVHEVVFPSDSLGPAQRDFLERTGQLASPPLLQQDARFVLSFRDAPAGRYPFRLQGNRASGDGVVIVVVDEGR